MSPARVVHYADSGGLQIAYEVLGDGPLDIVFAFDTGGNIDLMHEHPEIDRFLRRFSEYGRLIHMDLRGVGLSSPIEDLPTLEDWADDVRAVLAAVGSGRAAFVGHGYGAQLFMLFAAMHPNQTAALVTVNGYARMRQDDGYPWGMPPGNEAAMLEFIADNWGTGAMAVTTPGICHPRGLEWLARLERSSATPRGAAVRQNLAWDLDTRNVLPAIQAPTLVVQARDDSYIQRGHGQYLAGHITGARYFELPTADHVPFVTDTDALMDAIQEFLTGTTHRATTDRALKTVVFTDIVDSTRLASELGDRRWRGLLEMHESIALREIEAARGRLIKFTGDGLMATFDGPARAVQCVQTIGELLGPLDLSIRAGVHTGEVELIGDDIGGIAVHIAARISALAGAGEILTSSTVRDLVAGSGLEFEDRGERELKGVSGTWRVLAVK